MCAGVIGSRQGRVDLDKIDSDKTSRLVHTLADEVALTESETAADRGSRGRRERGIERIDVERKVDGGVVADVAEGHLHDATDAVPETKG